MSTISLISDIGFNSHNLSRFRQRFKKVLPGHDLEIIKADISRHDIGEAAYILESILPEFEDGSIHIVDVDPDLFRFAPALYAKIGEQWIITANNGLVSLLADKVSFVASETEGLSDGAGINSLLNTFLPMAKRLLEKGEKGLVEFNELREKSILQPVHTENEIRGTIIYVDGFGNAITNLKKEYLEGIAKGRRLAIVLNRHDRISKIHNYYGEVEPPDLLAVWSDSGHLQISIYQGDAARLMGLRKGKMISIELI